MTLNETKNEKYEQWLEENNLKERFTLESSNLLFKKDGGNAWVDETGKGFPALSNRLIWEGGFSAGVNYAQKEVGEKCIGGASWNKDSKGATLILSHDEVHNLIHALNEHTTNENLLKRLLTLDESWSDFENSRKAEEIGG